MNKVRNEKISDKIFDIFIYVFLWFSLVIVLYPLIYIVSASFSSPASVISGEVWLLPVEPTLMAYKVVLSNNQILTGFMNSFFYMFVGTALNIFMTMITAFPLSRKELVGRNLFVTLFMIPMFFSGGLIPGYLLVKNLGMLNTRWVMIIPAALSVWNMIIARTYIQSNIPDEMYEAAQIDGCNDLRFFSRMVVPLSGPIIAVLALYYGVGHWNSYFGALIYLKSKELYPLQLVLREILIKTNIDAGQFSDLALLQKKQGLIDLIKYAVIVVASVPVLCIYPFVQRHFVKGVMIGALKG